LINFQKQQHPYLSTTTQHRDLYYEDSPLYIRYLFHFKKEKMSNLDMESIENFTTNSNLERGKLYYNRGQISEINIYNNHLITAKVNGENNYFVYLEAYKKTHRSGCSCPYNSKGHCKHMVAVILAYMDKSTTYNRNIKISPFKVLALKFMNRVSIFLNRWWYKIS